MDLAREGGSERSRSGVTTKLRMVWRRAARRTQQLLLRLNWMTPLIVLIAGLLVVFVTSMMMYRTTRSADEQRLANIADEMKARVESELDQHLALLESTAALFHTFPGEIDRRTFADYIARLQLNKAFVGAQGLGYARRVEPREVADLERRMSEAYEREFVVWPDASGDVLYPILYLEPADDGNSAALGYNMASDEVRMAAMDKARESGAPAATGKVEIIRRDQADRHAGFVIYLPYYGPPDRDSTTAGERPLAGFIFAPFRARDFFTSALLVTPHPLVAIDIYDGTLSPETLLFSSEGRIADASAGDVVERVVAVAGRTWKMRFTPKPAFRLGSAGLYLPFVTALAILLSVAVALLFWQQVRVQQAAQQESRDKDLLLQEMKHRIKNSLARVQAISRQTARSAGDIETFLAKFDARLNSMSSAHDLLTRSHWAGAPLKDVLMVELLSMFGKQEANVSIDGPEVIIGPRHVMALGLTFHELATNALKYGAFATEEGSLSVTWEQTRNASGTPVVRIRWKEYAARGIDEPGGSGFGTRLMDATIAGDLGGRIERRFLPEGIEVVIEVPHARPVAAA